MRATIALLLCAHANTLVTPPRRQPTLVQAKKKEKKRPDYKRRPNLQPKKSLTDDVGAATATTPEGWRCAPANIAGGRKDRAQVQTEAMEDLKERATPSSPKKEWKPRGARRGEPHDHADGDQRGVPVFFGDWRVCLVLLPSHRGTNVFQPTARPRRPCLRCWGYWGLASRFVGVLGRGGRAWRWVWTRSS